MGSRKAYPNSSMLKSIGCYWTKHGPAIYLKHKLTTVAYVELHRSTFNVYVHTNNCMMKTLDSHDNLRDAIMVAENVTMAANPCIRELVVKQASSNYDSRRETMLNEFTEFLTNNATEEINFDDFD